MDKDLISDDRLGTVSIPMEELLKNPQKCVIDKSYPVLKKGSTHIGEIYI